MDEPRDRQDEEVENRQRPQKPGAGNFEAARQDDPPENDRWWENPGRSGEVH